MMKSRSITSGVWDFSPEDGIPVQEKKPGKRAPYVPTKRLKAQWVIRAWVISNATPTGHLHFANPLAAFETDCEDWEHLSDGQGYDFVIDSWLECWDRGGRPPYETPKLQHIWDPGFPKYHAKGRESMVESRHRWDLHLYDGGEIVRAIPCSDGSVRVAAELTRGKQVHIEGPRGEFAGVYPWGALSLTVGRHRLV